VPLTPPPATATPPTTASPTAADTPTPSAAPSRAPSPTPSPTATALVTPRIAFGDGTHVVGEDVEPGTYRTLEYTESCYWTRLSGFGSGLADWISSGIGPGYHVVTIGPDDAGIDSENCGSWTDDLGPVTDSPTGPIGEGTYIVGTDIAPGSWQATSGTNCYWARLSGFGGTEAEVIVEDLANQGRIPVVEIAATDAGFSSNGCGLWRRSG
jgi:hypothetical protein